MTDTEKVVTGVPPVDAAGRLAMEMTSIQEQR
jgi:hypothetical protein